MGGFWVAILNFRQIHPNQKNYARNGFGRFENPKIDVLHAFLKKMIDIIFLNLIGLLPVSDKYLGL